MRKTFPVLLVTACALATVGAKAADTAAVDAPAGTSTSEEHPGRGVRYQARFSYLTSRTAGHDYRSFRGAATDDTGAVTEGSSLPNLNYFSARLAVSPFKRHNFSVGTLQSLDSPAARTISGPSGEGRTLPGSIYSARYSYRLGSHTTFGMGETYVMGRKWSDPSLSLNYRPKDQWEQGWQPRFGLGASVPTTERSHNDQLITQATARTGISYVAGRWTTSGSLSYSRPIYAHPSKLAPSMWDSAPGDPAGSQSPHSHHGGHGGHGPHNVTPPNDVTGPVISDPNITNLEASDIVMSERTADRTTSAVGVSFRPSERWKIGSGAGVTYIETWKQKAIWLTNARLLGAAYDFWKMEAGSDVTLYSDIHKFRHPSLPSLMAIGFHLTYFMGADREQPLY